MTDAAPSANGNVPSAASAPGVNPVVENAAGQGDAERIAASAVPGPGGATVWPTWPGVTRPAGWFLPAPGEAAPPGGPQAEPARPDIPDQEGASASWRPDAGTWEAIPQSSAEAPGIGPTAALRGRAGGPGFEVPPAAPQEPPRPGRQSGWQRAQGVWQGLGIDWEQPPAPGPRDTDAGEIRNPVKDWNARQDWNPVQDWNPRQDFDPRQDWQSRQAEPPPAAASAPSLADAGAFASAPGYADVPPYDDVQPYSDGPYSSVSESGYWTGAVFRPSSTRRDSVVPGMRVRTDAADEMFRAWDSSVRQASGAPASGLRGSGLPGSRLPGSGMPGSGMPGSGMPGSGMPGSGMPGSGLPWSGMPGRQPARRRFPRDRAGQRRLARQAARVGLPAAVIAVVGAGAVMMLTSKSGETLGDRADQSATSIADGTVTGTFAGYPGKHGSVAVDSAGTAGAAQVAVGSADGYPAIWHRNANGTWSLVSASLPAAFRAPGTGAPDTGSLSSVAHGGAGWIAVGNDVSRSGNVPVVVTSADGVTWHVVTSTDAFSGPGLRVNAVAAGKNGYAVVGQQTQGSRQFAALWWSTDLRSWTRAGNGDLDGRLDPSDAYAVTATADGFVAVGSHGTGPIVWTTSTGLSWTKQYFGSPENGPRAMLLFAAANGSRIVAAGNATLPRSGDIVPFVMVSSDYGRSWEQVLLPAPAGHGTVTALTADGSGFTVSGQTGPAKEQHSVTWTSRDGQTWSSPAPATATGGA